MLQVPALMPKFGVSKGAGKRYRRIRRRHGVAQQQKVRDRLTGRPGLLNCFFFFLSIDYIGTEVYLLRWVQQTSQHPAYSLKIPL